MSGTYRHRKHYIEHSPEYDEDDGSKRVQKFAAHQDDSTHQYDHGYQDTIQPTTHHPGQHQSQPLPRYTARQPTQQFLQAPGDDVGWYSDECRNDYPVEHLIEPTVQDPYEGSIEHSLEDRNLHPRLGPNAQQAHGSRGTFGTAQVTEAFESLGLTVTSSSWGSQPAYSGPALPAQTTGAWYGGSERPPYDHPEWNPFGSVAANITGFERPGSEPLYSPADEWWLRMSIANAHDLNKVADTLKRPITSVLNYVGDRWLRWTSMQDDQLRSMNIGARPLMSDVRQYLDGSDDREDYEILARVNYLAWLDDPARQHAPAGTLQPVSEESPTPAGTPQPDSEQFPTRTRWIEPKPTQANQELATTTKLAPQDRKPWGADEIRELHEWVARHGTNWANVETRFRDRSRHAIVSKWGSIRKAAEDHNHALLGPEESDQPLLGSESDDQEQFGNKLENLTEKDFDFIKLRLAQGLRFSAIVDIYYRNFRQRTIIKFVYFAGWLPWTPAKDQQLLELQSQEGNRWEQISSRLPAPLRSQEEVKTRLEHLQRVAKGKVPQKTRASPYTFDQEDDDYIRLGLANGMSYAQMRRDEFPDLSAASISHHAYIIGAIWDSDADRQLLELNLEPDARPDWRYIGQSYDPPRKAKVVQARWQYFHSDAYWKSLR